MKYFLIGLSIFIVLTILSCKEKETGRDNSINSGHKLKDQDYSLHIVDTLALFLNTKTKYNGSYRLEYINNIEYLGYLNKDENTYTLYPLTLDMASTIIKFNRTGPNGIGQVFSVKLQNWDSVFVLRYHTNQLFLLDSSAVVKQKWVFSETNNGDMIFNIGATYSFPMYYNNHEIFIMNIGSSQVFTKEFWNNKLGLRIDLNKNIAYNDVGHYPDIYNNGICYGGWNYKGYRIVTKRKKEIYSYSLDNSIYIYNEESLEKAIIMTSPNVKIDVLYPKKTLTGYDIHDNWMYEIQKGSYRWMAYDEYRDIIYRLVVHAMEPYDTEGNKNKFWDKPFSIQIIDSAFTLIGEVDFPGKQYDFRNIIPSKDGLLISLCHDDNPILEEDKLKLARFELVKKDD